MTMALKRDQVQIIGLELLNTVSTSQITDNAVLGFLGFVSCERAFRHKEMGMGWDGQGFEDSGVQVPQVYGVLAD